MGGGHHHGHHGGGWRGGYPPYGPGWGYPWQAPATEVFVVDDSDKLERILAHVMTLPKSKRRAAYEKLTGRAAPASLGEYLQSRAADTLALGYLPTPGAPESLNGCGCGCGGAGTCGSLGGITDTIAALPTAAKIAGVVGLYFLYKKIKKRR